MTASTCFAAVDTTRMDWIPLRSGLSFKPLAYFPGGAGWQLLLRIEPGTVVSRHRHTGAVHAFHLEGLRRLDSGEVVGPGAYLHEPAGNVDSWEAVGEVPCVVHVEVNGRIEYLDADGSVAHVSDAAASRRTYLDWCAATGAAAHPAFLAEP